MTEIWHTPSRSTPAITKACNFMKQVAKTTLYLPEDLHIELKIQAARLRTSMTELVVRAIRHELRRLVDKEANRK